MEKVEQDGLSKRIADSNSEHLSLELGNGAIRSKKAGGRSPDWEVGSRKEEAAGNKVFQTDHTHNAGETCR